MAVDNVGMDVPIKFGDSSSNGFRGFRDIRRADFVSNERTLAKPIPIEFRIKTAKDRSYVSMESYGMGISLTTKSPNLQTGTRKAPFHIAAGRLEIHENIKREHLRIHWLTWL